MAYKASSGVNNIYHSEKYNTKGIGEFGVSRNIASATAALPTVVFNPSTSHFYNNEYDSTKNKYYRKIQTRPAFRQSEYRRLLGIPEYMQHTFTNLEK